MTDVERFWSKVGKGAQDACWPWLRFCEKDGYGRFWFHGANRPAHRHAWFLANGPIPVGIQILHRCDNPPCCNERHLFSGTYLDNNADKMAKGREERGSRHALSKLTEDDVIALRALRLDGWTQCALATRFGITQGTVWGILQRRTWKHV